MIGGVKGFPYSADEVTVTTQTLADGTTITHQRLVKVYQDSQGRTRREEYGLQTASAGQDATPQYVRIFDPVAGVSYILSPRDHTAHKRELRRRTLLPPSQTTGAAVNPTPAPPVPPPLRPTWQDLGTQVPEGLEARGARITTTIPAGAEGNDRPMQITTEMWTSPLNPRLPLMRITNDPRFGETVTRLTHLVRDEPPADLFRAPTDYTIEELQPVAKPASPSE
ncbi:MAG: hypothetical protein ACLQVL_02775 [Terriglobia bacterium]